MEIIFEETSITFVMDSVIRDNRRVLVINKIIYQEVHKKISHYSNEMDPEKNLTIKYSFQSFLDHSDILLKVLSDAAKLLRQLGKDTQFQGMIVNDLKGYKKVIKIINKILKEFS